MGLRVAAKAGKGDTRATNRRLVLQSLFRSEGVSRADLARLTQLTPATISQLVGDLLAERLAEEIGRGPAKVGKPSTMLRLRADARFVVCADLSDALVFRAAVVDLGGAIVHRVEASLGDAVGLEAMDILDRLLDDVMTEVSGPVLGIGIATPGVVTATGQVVEADNLGWFDFDLGDHLRQRFELPVSVVNDANAAVLAEYSHATETSQNRLVVNISRGVGAGIILNGQPYRGDDSAAGEIGHMVIADDGRDCRCGNRGCLETYVALPRLQAALDTGESRSAVVSAAGHHLGVALAAVVAVLDIRDIVITGLPSWMRSELCDAALVALHARTLTNVGSAVTLRPSTLGENVVLLGANVAVLSDELGVA